MKKLIDKIKTGIANAKMAALNFLNSERGDTNFISIAIILIVVIVIAVVFIGFGDKMVAGLEESIEDLYDALGI